MHPSANLKQKSLHSYRKYEQVHTFLKKKYFGEHLYSAQFKLLILIFHQNEI